MRVAIFTLFLVTTTAVTTALEPPESYVEHQLRGANTDRDLLSMSGGATSLSFSVSAARGADRFCFDYERTCLQFGDLFWAADTYTYTEGNAFALAYTKEYLWLHTACRAYSAAYARACAFIKVDGKVKVDTSVQNAKKNVSLSVYLRTGAMTFALAQTVAMAKAYAEVGAKSFTNVQAYCAEVNNMSILCAGGTASTDLKQIAKARATAFGSARAEAQSGAGTNTNAVVSAQGPAIDFISGAIWASAWSWAFSNAAASAKAIADAFTTATNDSLAEVCVAIYGEICKNQNIGICGLGSDVACAQAMAKGEAYASALSEACAQEFINAWAGASANVYLSANVDCQSTPKLTWTTADAGVGLTCVVG